MPDNRIILRTFKIKAEMSLRTFVSFFFESVVLPPTHITCHRFFSTALYQIFYLSQIWYKVVLNLQQVIWVGGNNIVCFNEVDVYQ